MLTPQQLQNLPKALTDSYSDLAEFVLRDIARRIAKGAGITDTAEYQLYRARALGLSTKEITEKIAEINGVSAGTIEQLIRDAAAKSDEFDRRMLGADSGAAIPLSENEQLQKIMAAEIKQTHGACENYTRTLGFAEKNADGQVIYSSLQDFLHKEMDSAHMKVVNGVTDYNTALRQACEKLAASGVRTVYYNSGHSDRIEVAVRRALMTSVSQVTQRVSEQNAELFGADGWEISAHSGARPSHAVYQGRQYPNSKYDSIVRPLIEDYNCRHSAYPIIMGVTKPSYTEEELSQLDPPPITYEGKTYTAYEAQQQMRKMERAMRKQKDRCIAADAAGDKESFTTASIKLRRQKDIYEDFCKAAGTYTEYERTFVVGYSKRLASKTGAVTKVQNVIKNFRNRLKNIDTSGIIDPREKSFLEELKKGSIPVNIDTKRQINHIVSKQWKHNAAQEIKRFRSLLQQNTANTSTPKMHIPSRFYANINPEYMVAKYAGTGKFSFQKNNPFPDEFVSSRNYIGITFDKKKNKYVKTKRMQIKYTQNGIHIFPVLDL